MEGLNKKQIKAIVKRLKYYDSKLNERRDLIDLIGIDDEKSQRRYFKETYVCTRLFQIFIYRHLKDKRFNITQDQALTLMQSEEAKRNGKIEINNIVLLYMPKEEFLMYNEIYTELSDKI